MIDDLPRYVVHPNGNGSWSVVDTGPRAGFVGAMCFGLERLALSTAETHAARLNQLYRQWLTVAAKVSA